MQEMKKQKLYGHTVRTIGSEPFYLARDIAEMIDYACTSKGTYETSKMLKSVDDQYKFKSQAKWNNTFSFYWFLTKEGVDQVIEQNKKEKEDEYSLQDAVAQAPNTQVFTHPDFGNLRSVVINDEPWFVGKDVAEALGYAEPRSAVSKKVVSEDRGVAEMETPSGKQKMTTINESGLYSLILGSKLKSAKKFKYWVTSEVLPSIRKHGGYIKGQETLSDEQLLSQALLVAQRKIEERNKLLEEQKPLVDFALQVTDSSDTISISTLANLIHKNNYIDIGRNRLFSFLRQNKILKRNNLPYQRYMHWFKVIEGITQDFVPYTQALVTGKGQVGITNLVLEKWCS